MSLRGVRRVKLPVRKLAPGAIGLEGCKMTGNQNDRKLSPERGGRGGVAPHRAADCLADPGEPIAAGGSVPDALMILGKRIVGVVVECFMLSYDGRVIELISTAAPTTCSGPPQRTPGQTLGCSDGRHWRATAAATRAVVGK